MSLVKREAVSIVYAKALFEMAQEQNQVSEVQAQLKKVALLLSEQSELKEALSSYMFSARERQKLAAEVSQKIELHPMVAKLVDLLVAKNRVLATESIFNIYQELVDASHNLVRGTVTTVDVLADSERDSLSQAFERKLNKKVILETRLDKTILGGLIVNIQGLTFDGSLKTTIRRLKENLERQSI